MYETSNCCRGAEVAFGETAESAFKQFRDYHDSDAEPESMVFYELGNMKTATVTWALS